MKSKHSVQERIALIEKILSGDSISSVAKDSKISRTLLHRWLKRYKEFGRKGLIPKTSGRPKKSKTPKKLGPVEPLSSHERFRMVQEVLEEGKSASEIAKKYGISRVSLYKWIRRFKEAPDKRLAAVEDKERKVKHYFRQTPEKYEEVILNLVARHPEYGVRRLLQEVPKIGGKPIIGHHGIQNVLRRHDLSIYEQRLAYAQAQITPVTRIITQVIGFASRFFAIPQIPRARIVRFGAVLALSMFATVVILGLGSFLAATFVSVPLATKIGLIFATSALFFGSVFFLYSLKYYLSLAIVLSFGQQEVGETNEGGLLNGSGSNRFLSWILGLGKRKEEGRRKAIGLKPNLEHITLKRYPKISVHIPLYNEKNVVERLLSAVTSFDYQGDYEIIIADDSTDETTTFIRSYLERKGKNLTTRRGDGWTLASAEISPGVVLKHLHRTSRSGFKGGALKEALVHTDPKVEFISVFDADFVPYPDTLELFLKYFQATAGTLDFRGQRSEVGKEKLTSNVLSSNASNIAAVQGYQWHVLNKSENWITRGIRSEYAGSYVIERSGTEIYSGLKQISGSVYMIRRDVLDEIGWETSITEDFQLTLKLYEKGYKVVYTPYIQAPAECVSTLKRLIRQRMRWAEGHSNNIRRMFVRLMFGKWEVGSVKVDPASHLPPHTSRKWTPSPLTLSEKLEFLYLSPYYLQAFFFLVGTLSWLISETLFPARLPFWTTLWGWSLVLTNMLSLPLMNAVGLFLEESEERDYLGTLSFFAMVYVLVPFQAYAALKGFLQKEEGPWFRTPKTGRITDVFTRGRFYRFITGILPGRKTQPAVAQSIGSRVQAFGSEAAQVIDSEAQTRGARRGLGSSLLNPNFSFSIRPRRKRWLSKATLAGLLIVVLVLNHLSFFSAPVALAAHGPHIEQQINITDQEVSGIDPRIYWRMDDVSGSTVTDYSGNGTDATATGTTIVDGKYSKARDFDGSSDSTSVTVSFTASSGTVELWANPDFAQGDGVSHDFISWGVATTDFRITKQANGVFLAGFFNGVEYRVNLSSGSYTLPQNQWFQITLVWDSTGTKLYFDDVFQGENTTAPNTVDPSSIVVGKFSDGTDYFDGTIDDVRIFTYRRTVSQISDDFNDTGGVNKGIIKIDTAEYSGTVTYYFDIVAKVTSGTGTTSLIYDSGTGSAPSGGAPVDLLSITATSYTRYRSSSFSPSGAQNAYMSIPAGSGIAIKAARIIIVQSDATLITGTQTQVEVGNNESTTSTTETTLANPKYYQFDADKFSGTVNAFFEATIRTLTVSTTATYYFDGHDVTQEWATNPAQMVDGSTTTFAVTGGGDETQLNNTNTNNGTNLGDITKVELRVYGCQDNNDNGEIRLRPVFSAGDGDLHNWLAPDSNNCETSVATWSPYFDITNDTNAEDWAEWTDIQNLDVDVVGERLGGPDVIHASKVEIQVTYDEAGTAYAELFNRTNGVVVTNSVVSTTSSNPALVRGASALTTNWDTTNDDEYEVRIKTSDASITANIYSAKIILDQTDVGGLTDIEMVHQYVNTLTTETGASYVAQDFDNLYDANNFSAGTFTYYFESTLRNNGGTSNARLTPGALGSVTGAASYTRSRSASISPVDDTTYDTEMANADAASSWLIIQVSTLQIPENLWLFVPLALFLPKLLGKRFLKLNALNFSFLNQKRHHKRRRREIYDKSIQGVDDG